MGPMTYLVDSMGRSEFVILSISDCGGAGDITSKL